LVLLICLTGRIDIAVLQIGLRRQKRALSEAKMVRMRVHEKTAVCHALFND
jgi:hypothetical protein